MASFTDLDDEGILDDGQADPSFSLFKSDVCTHDNCAISSIRGLRNGFYYGAKVRISHAIVMGLLFGKGNYFDILKNALNLAW